VDDGMKLPLDDRPAAGASARAHGCRGLTKIEVLAVVAVVAILVAVLLHALSRAKPAGQSTVCLNNLKQMQLGWQKYANDHEGKLPCNLAAPTNGVWRSAPDSWIGDSNAQEDLDTSRIEHGVFYQGGYLRNLRLYQCPDDETGRTRSYSLNANLNAPSWGQAIAKTTADIPSPARLFTFLDELEASIDDGVFLMSPGRSERWDNRPADRHSQGCNFAFADGHAEHWTWKAPKRRGSVGSEDDQADFKALQAVSLR
jgi:prepilin-type processing-associated H-X9-DG protein